MKKTLNFKKVVKSCKVIPDEDDSQRIEFTLEDDLKFVWYPEGGCEPRVTRTTVVNSTDLVLTAIVHLCLSDGKIDLSRGIEIYGSLQMQRALSGTIWPE